MLGLAHLADLMHGWASINSFLHPAYILGIELNLTEQATLDIGSRQVKILPTKGDYRRRNLDSPTRAERMLSGESDELLDRAKRR